MKPFFKSPTGSKLLVSLVLFVLGLLLLIAPMGTLTAYVRVIGVIFLAAAAVAILFFAFTKPAERSPMPLIGGITGAVIGLIFVAAPGLVTNALPFVFGLLLLIASVSDLFSALALPFGRLISIILSLIGIILGLVIIMNPAMIAAIVTRVIGIGFIYEAVVWVVTALYARRTLR